MSCPLLEVIARRQGSRPAVWIDFLTYAQRLFLGGAEVPWLRPAEFLSLHRQAQALVRSDVACLPLARVCAAWLEANPILSNEMSRKERRGSVLKHLFADERFRRSVVELLRAVRHAHASLPLVISVPSPRRWLVEARAGADDNARTAPSEDDVDRASVDVAGWLRSLADSSIDGLLIEEEPTLSASPRRLYRPVWNVAMHYRWATGVLTPGSFSEAVAGVDFQIADVPPESGVRGVIIHDSFWEGSAPPRLEGEAFYYVRVPSDAVPERVLERLAALR